MSADLTLQEAADALGVHYMTAYRYVRLGLLEAAKSGGAWRVTPEALQRFRDGGQNAPVGRGADRRSRPAPWAGRLESRLIAGDDRGAWGVVEAAMAAGADLNDVYLDVLSPAMVSIGDRWRRGELDVAVEHRASGIVIRILGRLGHRFVRRGRSRGALVVGAPAGESHSLPTAILSDLLRLRGWEVSDLGADVPHDSFVYAVQEVEDAVAVGFSVTSEQNLASLSEVCAAMRAAHPGVFLIAGGRAIEGVEHARSLGADSSAASGAEMHDRLVALLAEEPPLQADR
jgi:excisionase family DNA binding protein